MSRSIVLNHCYGGFSLSPEAMLDLYNGGWKELGTPVENYFGGAAELRSALEKWRQRAAFAHIFSPDEKFVLCERCFKRDDPRLVEVVERLGKKANGTHASLEVVKIPMDAEWEISDYDGFEQVEEVHRSWP